MNKTIDFSGRENAEKRIRDMTCKVPRPGFLRSDSIYSSVLAMAFSKSAASLAAAIAVLSGCWVAAMPLRMRISSFRQKTASIPSPDRCEIPPQYQMVKQTLGVWRQMGRNLLCLLMPSQALFEEFETSQLLTAEFAQILPVPAGCKGLSGSRVLLNT